MSFLIDNGIYKGLSRYENHVIEMYLTDFNPEKVSEMMRFQRDISKGMSDFIADVLDGKIKRKKGHSTLRRDAAIFREIIVLLESNFNLTSNSTEDGAAAIVAQRLDLSEEVVLKAYERIKKKIKNDHGTTHYTKHKTANISLHIGGFDPTKIDPDSTI